MNEFSWAFVWNVAPAPLIFPSGWQSAPNAGGCGTAMLAGAAARDPRIPKPIASATTRARENLHIRRLMLC